MHSRKNVYWNLRTLTMMHRAGLVALRGPAPRSASEEQADGESETFRLVEIRDPRHLDYGVWRQRIVALRDARHAEAEAGLTAMVAMLGLGRLPVGRSMRLLPLERGPPVGSCLRGVPRLPPRWRSPLCAVGA